MSLYAFTLFCHSYLRWAILIFLLVLLTRCVRGLRTNRPWTERDERLHVILISLIDLQFLLGIALYFGLSPLTRAFLDNPGAGMKQSVIRFFGMEHVLSNLVGIVLLHIGRVRSRRAPNTRTRRLRVLVSLAIALLLFLIAMPWPGLPYGRPLFRFGS